MYRLTILEIIVRSILGLLVSCIVSIVLVIFTYPSLGLFTVYFCTIFLIWYGFVCSKKITIGEQGITLSTFFTKKYFSWDMITSYRYEKYDAFRFGSRQRAGASIIRIFNPSYGLGSFVILTLRSGQYRFYLTCYKFSEELKKDLSTYIK